MWPGQSCYTNLHLFIKIFKLTSTRTIYNVTGVVSLPKCLSNVQKTVHKHMNVCVLYKGLFCPERSIHRRVFKSRCLADRVQTESGTVSSVSLSSRATHAPYMGRYSRLLEVQRGKFDSLFSQKQGKF